MARPSGLPIEMSSTVSSGDIGLARSVSKPLTRAAIIVRSSPAMSNAVRCIPHTILWGPPGAILNCDGGSHDIVPPFGGALGRDHHLGCTPDLGGNPGSGHRHQHGNRDKPTGPGHGQLLQHLDRQRHFQRWCHRPRRVHSVSNRGGRSDCSRSDPKRCHYR